MKQALNLAMPEYRDLLIGEGSLHAIGVVSQPIIVLVVILCFFPGFFCLMALVEVLVTNDEVSSLKIAEVILVLHLVSYQWRYDGL